MSERAAARSTWIHQQNPLTDGLPRFADFDAMGQALAFDPLTGIDVNALDLATRVGLLSAEKSPLQPTSVSIQSGLIWQGMLMTGLDRRNPLNIEARRAYWRTLTEGGHGAVPPLKLPTKGMAIHIAKGPAGTGKTVTADRFCDLFPQVIERGDCQVAGWKRMLQLLWLKVDMSADGSRGGFVTGALLQMDQALGTNYATSLRKQFRTVEQLTVALIDRLIAHWTGLVILDEGQLRNLVLCGQADLIQLFLLQLMNSGIPMVFIGNERAFDWVEYSQDLTRLMMIPSARFSPPGSLRSGDLESPAALTAKALADADALTLADGVMSYYLLREPPELRVECMDALLLLSGRVARLALTLWTTAQLQALLIHGREHVIPDDIQAAYDSPEYDELRPLADGFAYRKPELFVKYPDVASAFYRKVWGLPTDEGNEHQEPDKAPEAKTQTPSPRRRAGSRSGKSKHAAEKTRQTNAAKERKRLEQTLKDEDMRKNGLVNHALDGLEALRRQAAAGV